MGTFKYGLEQARAQLPLIASEAHAGNASIITRHGKPIAAVVPVQQWQEHRASQRARSGLLALRGSGRGLWGKHAGLAVAALRDEWGQN